MNRSNQQVKVHWLGFNDAWDSSSEQSKLKVKSSEVELLIEQP